MWKSDVEGPNGPDDKIRYRFFTFVGPGDVIDIRLVMNGDQLIFEEIIPGGPHSKWLMEKYFPNKSVEETLIFLKKRPWVINRA